MLSSLHVRNLALIEEQEIEFSGGLNILTGETGAGKSVLIGGINLALGAKADASMIRTGADHALAELVFTVEDKETLAEIREMGLTVEDDGELILQRKIMDGRSSCKCNGENVTARQMRELAERLITVHGQNDHQELLNPLRQLQILDDYAGNKAQKLLQQCSDSHIRVKELSDELERLCLDDRERVRELELARFEVEEIDQAALKDGEDETLETDYRRLLNSEKLSKAVQTAEELMVVQGGGVSDAVARALRELNSVAQYDDGIGDLAAQLSDIEALMGDFERGLSLYAGSLEYDPELFAETEERLNTINHLKDRYGGSIENIRRYRDDREQAIEELEQLEERRDQVRKELGQEKERLLAACAELSQLRKKEGKKLADGIRKALEDLNFLEVRFSILVEPDEERAGSRGYDSVTYMISTNPGEELRPLNHVASGGELSRIMLAFQTVVSGKDGTDTFVFDEIDTGISGQTAWKVSEKLHSLAADHQLICITHLPQIAAMADEHFMIHKEIEGERTVTRIEKLGTEDSDRELARMLGGAEITEKTLDNAREMRSQARAK